jgi:class 3 adenylate cyclase
VSPQATPGRQGEMVCSDAGVSASVQIADDDLGTVQPRRQRLERFIRLSDVSSTVTVTLVFTDLVGSSAIGTGLHPKDTERLRHPLRDRS